MMCPCCKSELLEVRRLDQTEQVARGEFERAKLHVCQRCGGGWINRRQLAEILLERLQQVGLGELDRTVPSFARTPDERQMTESRASVATTMASMPDFPVRLLEHLEGLIDDALELHQLDAAAALGILNRLSAAADVRSARGDDEIVLLLRRMRTSALAAESRNEAALDSFVKDGWSLVVEFQKLFPAGRERAGKTRFQGLNRNGCGASRQAGVGT